ncbi:FUN14 domain-containing 1-like [Brachionus plicatilis]|uniref:FUN14 domain-containing 1-like n=1 Tax=Brachionus plicatilis TaxID=10195 RepID=A0A3M7S951_BRAPC|nr:FUN14 domain-containing 1-like [Brachionus plicatilis]
MPSSNSVSDFIRNSINEIKEMSTLNQVFVGGSAGLATGYVTSKVGRMAAFTVGSSLIMLQLAQHFGYIEIKWGKKSSKIKDLKKKAIEVAEETGLLDSNSQNEKLERAFGFVKKFMQENFAFGISFGGGLLIGISI